MAPEPANIRQPTAWERQLFDRLLALPFPGRDALRTQLQTALVREIDRNHSLEFQVTRREAAGVRRRIPIEAECEDVDGMRTHALLHVVDGIVHELEFYKDDASPTVFLPAPELWRLVQLDYDSPNRPPAPGAPPSG